MDLPRMIRIRQHVETPQVDDVPGEVERELAALRLSEQISAGQTVAVTAGSRGIANIAAVTKAICDHVRGAGGVPVIIPSMGNCCGGSPEPASANQPAPAEPCQHQTQRC